MQREKNRLSENLWLPIQFVALASIVLSTLASGLRGGGTTVPVVSEVDSTHNVAPLRVSAVSFAKGVRPKTITSRVVALPHPFALPQPGAVELEVETAQLRFEKAFVANEGVPMRGPNSLRASPAKTWNLVGIRRKLNENWESVPLVGSESQRALGSVFVELQEGLNEFEVTFRDAGGRESSYPVRVRHFRKHTPS